MLLVLLLDSPPRGRFAEVARGTVNANRFSPRDMLVSALVGNAAAIAVKVTWNTTLQ